MQGAAHLPCMRILAKQAGDTLKGLFEFSWNYLGSLAAMCLLVGALGLGIYHTVLPEASPLCRCYAGVLNTAGAEPPGGVTPLGRGEVRGVPHVRLEYDGAGRVSRMKSVDARRRLAALPGSRVAEQLLHYDGAGRLVRKENRDATGVPAEDAHGVAQRLFERDAAGRVVRTEFRNAAGERTMPRYPGYAECRVAYDSEGRPLRVEYLDAAGVPVQNAAGEEVVEYRYGEDGSVRRSNLVGGRLADNHAGIAQEVLSPCEQGTCREWKNREGELVLHPASGAAALHHEAVAQSGLERRRFMDATGAPCEASRACAEHLVRHGSSGKPEWECYSGADGLPVNHPALGYAERICLYAPDGRLAREYFWNEQGLPAEMNERRHVDTQAGAYSLSLHSDGSTRVQPENGI